VKRALLAEKLGKSAKINRKITVELSDFVADNQSAEVFLSGIPADDFQAFRGESALPAPVRRLHFAFGFLAGAISRLFRSREARRQEALHRWSAQWRKWVARLMSGNTASLEAMAPATIAPLQQALVGKSRADVVVTLGPPPGTSSAETNQLGTRHYWHADTWYYPLDLNRRQAVAISFNRNQVTSIERVAGPPQ